MKHKIKHFAHNTQENHQINIKKRIILPFFTQMVIFITTIIPIFAINKVTHINI